MSDIQIVVVDDDSEEAPPPSHFEPLCCEDVEVTRIRPPMEKRYRSFGWKDPTKNTVVFSHRFRAVSDNWKQDIILDTVSHSNYRRLRNRRIR